jgi:hypothetical protein
MQRAGAFSDDGGATWERERLLYRSPDGTICECCPPAVSFDPRSGEALVSFRNWLGGNRDPYLLRLAPHAAAPEAAAATADGALQLGKEHWPLLGCPVAGPSVAATLSGRALGFWRRQATLYAAEPGRSEVAVAEGREALVAAGGAGLHLLWTDTEGGLRIAHAPDGPDASFSGDALQPQSLGRGFNAALAGAPDGRGPVLAVWESGEPGPANLRFAVVSERSARP